MRSKDEFRRILELWEQGKTKAEISRLLNIPVYSVKVCTSQYATVAEMEKHLSQERTRRSYTDQQFIEAVQQSRSIAQVLRKIGIRPAGGNYELAKQRIKELRLDTSHLVGGGWAKGTHNHSVPKVALNDVLIKDSPYRTSSRLKTRLIEEGYLEAECSNCHLTRWQNQPIPLELHHINGDRFDNRLENLSLLCPNCHALTATYRARNKKKQPRGIN
jgi:hypothetical protein